VARSCCVEKAREADGGDGWGGLGLGLAGLGYEYGYGYGYGYGYSYPYDYAYGYGYPCRRRLLRDSREDLLTLPYIVGREWLFLHGLPRPRAGNGGIESSNAERFGSFDETAAETVPGRSFLESA
jgi:hypothetical protein